MADHDGSRRGACRCPRTACAWTLIAATLSVPLSVAGELIYRQRWTAPFVLAGTPALLGGGAGLLALFSVLAPIVKSDPHRRTANPADSGTGVGGQVGQAQLLLYLAVVSILPALGTVLVGTLTRSTATVGAGIGIGVLTGAGSAWLGGRVACRRLRLRGPELLNRPHKGTIAPATEDVAADAKAAVVSTDAPTGGGRAHRRHIRVFRWLTGGFFFVCQGDHPVGGDDRRIGVHAAVLVHPALPARRHPGAGHRRVPARWARPVRGRPPFDTVGPGKRRAPSPYSRCRSVGI